MARTCETAIGWCCSTSTRTPGTPSASRCRLCSGAAVDDGLALTAVGDPIQSIYGWRGASATNLPRFTTDFPRSDGTPAPVLELRTSWRNPPRALHVANAISAEARRRSVAVQALRSRPDAPPGTVRCALLPDVRAEREWIADHLHAHYQQARADGVSPPTAAVLVRRNADAAPIADALRARGIPVEVVGLAGLLSIPEVADVVAMLRLVADPTAGAAAMRVLTGPRWRLGGRDIAALWRRAVALSGRQPGEAPTPESIAMAAGPDAGQRVSGRRDQRSRPGRLVFGCGISAHHARWPANCIALRGHLGHSAARPGRRGAARAGRRLRSPGRSGGHRGLVRQPNTSTRSPMWSPATPNAQPPRSIDYLRPSVLGLLSYLDVAEVVENGLAPAQLAVARDRVQVLTVHAAKGLEWQVVAVAHLSGGIFPSTASRSSWLTDAAELPPLLRGDRACAGALGIPVLDTSDVTNRKQLSDKISEHRRQLDQRRVDEERRLLYVGITRAEDTLLVSGHHWGSTGIKPRGPSDFLCELKGIIDRSAAAGDPCGVVEHWAPAPADGERNPLRDSVVEAVWPADPLAGRRGDVERGAALVAQAMSADPADPAPAGADVDGWIADVDALLAERACAAKPSVGALPSQLSVSSLVDLARDPAGAAQRLMHRLPTRPDPHALLGNTFHAWVQRFYGAERLFDLGDLPGAADSDVGDTEELAALQAAFAGSQWAARTPIAVEVPFEMPIGDTVLRGRIDAVFADPDGGATVVDWKTGEPPRGPEALRHAAVQLAVYRLAWAALSGCPESSVRAAFYYVRTGAAVVPEDLPDPAELTALLAVSAGGDR